MPARRSALPLSSDDFSLRLRAGGQRPLARALADIEGLDAETIARKSMKVAAEICVYTNHEVVVESLETA